MSSLGTGLNILALQLPGLCGKRTADGAADGDDEDGGEADGNDEDDGALERASTRSARAGPIPLSSSDHRCDRARYSGG